MEVRKKTSNMVKRPHTGPFKDIDSHQSHCSVINNNPSKLSELQRCHLFHLSKQYSNEFASHFLTQQDVKSINHGSIRDIE